MASRQSETKDFDFWRSSVVGIFFALTEFPTRSHLFACWQCESPALNCALVARLLASPWKNLLSGPPRGLIYSDDRFRVFTSFPLSRRVRFASRADIRPMRVPHRPPNPSTRWLITSWLAARAPRALSVDPSTAVPSCISPNSLAPALSVPESASASFPRSLGNRACEAELIKTRSLEPDSGARRRWPEPGEARIDLFSLWGQGHKARDIVATSTGDWSD